MSRSRVLAMAASVAFLGFSGAVSAQIDTTLQTVLLEMGKADQRVRGVPVASGDSSGTTASDWEALAAEMERVDAKNLQRLEEIIATHGWPGESLVGRVAAMSAFIVLQHADHATQVRYFPLVEEAVESGELEGQALALLQDRILIRDGKKQIYGTQLRRNEKTHELEPYPVEDEENVDARRAELGMGPLEEYVELARKEYDG